MPANNRYPFFRTLALYILVTSTLLVQAWAPSFLSKWQDQLTSSSRTITTSRMCTPSKKPSPPPWSFQVQEIYYQFRWVRSEKARNYCPGSDDLFLISLGGYTLGGVFCVEYCDSPIGPYREVASLSSLVARRSGIGAWASHIVVDSVDAAQYGKDYWGLPAVVLPITFDPGSAIAAQEKTCNISVNDHQVSIQGWKRTNLLNPTAYNGFSWSQWLDISLPSFSGRLAMDLDKGDAVNLSPLLRYPLRIQSPQSISVVDEDDDNDEYTSRLEFSGAGSLPNELQDLFADSSPALTLRIHNLTLTAGTATIESP